MTQRRPRARACRLLLVPSPLLGAASWAPVAPALDDVVVHDRHTRETVEVAATCQVHVVDSAEEKRGVMEFFGPVFALYTGGMGAKEQNFHTSVIERMGYAALANEVHTSATHRWLRCEGRSGLSPETARPDAGPHSPPCTTSRGFAARSRATSHLNHPSPLAPAVAAAVRELLAALG